MASSSSGSDVDDALSLIEQNGGLGEFETDTPAGEVERWLFPRFPGASDNADMYLSRSGLGTYESDVETIEGWLNAPRNIVGAIYLRGEPGGGKTALIEAAVTRAERRLLTLVCTPDHTKDSLYLKFMGEGRGDCMRADHNHDHDHVEPVTKKGRKVKAIVNEGECTRSPFTLGPFPFAAKYGYTLYCDEVLLLVDGVKPLLYPLADGRKYLPEGNVDGSALEIHDDFRLVFSANPDVRGASLPEPLGSRCASTTITIETSESMLLDLGIDEAIVQAWVALGTQGLWRPAVREMRLADYWLDTDVAQAVSAFLPEHCPESQRKAIRDIVVGHLGGTIRDDGRLVVS